MVRLALRSFAEHRGSAIATGLVALVGTALVCSMTCLLATGLASSTAGDDRPFLTQFPIILGGWVVAIVLFAMISTIGVALEGRGAEIAGLRLIGATPRQVQLQASVETLVVSGLAALPGLGLGYALGWGILQSVRNRELVDDSSAYAPGYVVPAVGAVIVLVTSVVAAWIGSRRLALKNPAAEGPGERVAGTSRAVARRVVAGCVVAAGCGSALAVLALDADDILTTAMTGPACVLVSVGLCLLAPELLMLVNALLRITRTREGRAADHLATINLALAPERVRPVVTFLTLFIGVAGGTLAMQGIENAHASSGSTAQVLASVNYLVVFLIAAFMAIALTNNLVAAVGRRRAELVTLSLVGSTAAMSRAMVLREVCAAILVSATVGTLGAVVCNLPFALVKTGSAGAALAPFPYLVSVVAGGLIALGVTALATSRTLRSIGAPAARPARTAARADPI